MGSWNYDITTFLKPGVTWKPNVVGGFDWGSGREIHYPAVLPTPPSVPVVTGIKPADVVNTLYGKPIPLSALGLARIGTAGLVFGPYPVGGSTVSFGVSFGFPANPSGTRRVYEIAFDGKVFWELAAGSAAGTIDASGFLTEPITIRFYSGTMTQAADPLEISYFGSEAVAYRPQMMLFIENLPLARFNNVLPFVSAKFGDTTSGAVPADGLNIGECLERFAYSPFIEYTSADFECVGTADIVQAMILTEDQSFLQLLQNTARFYRTLDILQTDKLRVSDRGSTVAADLALGRNHVVDEEGVKYVRLEEPSVSRELEFITIDPDADYVFIPSKASRPRYPVPVTSAVGKETMTLPVVIGATTRASAVTYAKYEEDNARKRVSLRAMLYGLELEPGDLFSLDNLVDGFETLETFKITETSHNGDWTVTIIGESILKCAIPTTPPEVTYITHREVDGTSAAQTYLNVNIGTPAADRLVVITAGGITNNRTIDSITLGGTPMTLHQSISGGGTVIFNDPALAIASLVVPTGTSATVVVNFSNVLEGSFIGVHTITGYASATPADFDEVSVVGTDPSVTLAVPGGAAIIAAYCNNGLIAGVTWDGLEDEDFDEAIEVGASFPLWGSAAHQYNAGESAGRTITVDTPSANRNLLVAACWS